jgi:hypothetical protein
MEQLLQRRKVEQDEVSSALFVVLDPKIAIIHSCPAFWAGLLN